MKIDQIDSGSLRSRLDAMAREHGLTRWIGAGLISGLTALVAWGGLPSRTVVRAERLELRDRQGRLRAELALDPQDGAPRLALLDDEGDEQVALIASKDGSGMFLSGPGGIRIALNSWGHGIPSMDLRGPEGRGNASLYVDTDGSLGLAAESGGRRAKWNLRPDEQDRPVMADRALSEGSAPGSHPTTRAEAGRPRQAPD